MKVNERLISSFYLTTAGQRGKSVNLTDYSDKFCYPFVAIKLF